MRTELRTIKRTAILVLAITVVGLSAPAGEDAPTYKGKTLDEWVRQLDDAAPAKRRVATSALSAIKASPLAVIPSMVKMLEDRDANVRDAAVAALYGSVRAAWGRGCRSARAGSAGIVEERQG